MFGRPGSSSLFEAFFRDPLFPNDPLFTSRPRDLSDVQHDSGMPSRARQSMVCLNTNVFLDTPTLHCLSEVTTFAGAPSASHARPDDYGNA